MHQHDGHWWATEVTLVGDHLAYGTYWYQTNSRTDVLDPNVTFGGGFSFDDYGDEVSLDGSHNREIDIGEDSRWGGVPHPNTQNVSSRSTTCRQTGRTAIGSIFRTCSSDPALTRIMIWRPDSIRFVTVKGHYTPYNYPPAAVMDEYTYTHNPAEGRYVPLLGRERLHFNLWLNKTVNPMAPADGQPVEVIIPAFGFVPLANCDFNGDDNSDILWRRASDGLVQMWLMDGSSIRSATNIGGGTDWPIAGVGDFDSDGKADILWRRASDGLVQMWLMDGPNIRSR